VDVVQVKVIIETTSKAESQRLIEGLSQKYTVIT
jgi:hypothetical protein